MFPSSEPRFSTRRPPSVLRRLLVFAAAVLAPVLVGAFISGMLLRDSAANSEQLAAEIVSESRAGVSLLQGLQAARLAGSDYMEEGELDELEEFRVAER